MNPKHGVLLALAVAALVATACAVLKVSTPRPKETRPVVSPPRAHGLLEGHWSSPLAGFSIGALDASPERLLVGGRAGNVMELRLARWNGQELVFDPPIVVPLPPRVSAERELVPVPSIDDGRPDAVAVARVDREFAGGEGIAVYTDIRAKNLYEIKSPLDADMAFGEPVVLRGDEVFALEPYEYGQVWHYRRGGAGQRLLLPPGISTLGGNLALSLDGATLAVTSRPRDRHRLERYERRGATFVHVQSMDLPAAPTGAVFTGDLLTIGFICPADDGSAVWELSRTANGFTPARKVRVPVDPSNNTAVHELDAHGRWAVVVQLDALFAIDLTRGEVACELRLPPPELPNRPRRPRATMMGERVVAVVGNRLGVYDLAACRPLEP